MKLIGFTKKRIVLCLFNDSVSEQFNFHVHDVAFVHVQRSAISSNDKRFDPSPPIIKSTFRNALHVSTPLRLPSLQTYSPSSIVIHRALLEQVRFLMIMSNHSFVNKIMSEVSYFFLTRGE